MLFRPSPPSVFFVSLVLIIQNFLQVYRFLNISNALSKGSMVEVIESQILCGNFSVLLEFKKVF